MMRKVFFNLLYVVYINLSLFQLFSDPEIKLEIGCSDTDDYIFGWIKAVELDQRGYIYTFDAQRDRYISVFNLSGEKVGKIGNAGYGPGEFTGLTNFHLDNVNGIITALDFRQSKISAFSINENGDGKLIDEIFFERYISDSPQTIRPVNVFRLMDGNYIIHYEGIISPNTAEYPALHHLVILDSESVKQKEILSLREDEQLIEIKGRSVEAFKWPHAGKSTIAVDPTGLIFAGWSYDHTIQLLNTMGDVKERIKIPEKVMYLSREDKNYLLRDYPQRFYLFRRKVRNLIHDTWPYFEDKLIDDEGNLWVGLFDENFSTSWNAYTSDGDNISSFTLQNRDRIKSMSGKYMAAVRTLEIGSECIVIYKKINANEYSHEG